MSVCGKWNKMNSLKLVHVQISSFAYLPNHLVLLQSMGHLLKNPRMNFTEF